MQFNGKFIHDGLILVLTKIEEWKKKNNTTYKNEHGTFQPVKNSNKNTNH